MFGINEKGETASIFVEGFTPFFYVMVDDSWEIEKRMVSLENCISKLATNIGKGRLLSQCLLKEKNCMGFQRVNLTSSYC